MASDADHIEDLWPQLGALERTLDRLDGRTVGGVAAEDARSVDERDRDLLRTVRARASR